MYHSLPGEQALRAKAAFDRWYQISKAVEKDIDLQSMDEGIARYTSAKKLFHDFIEGVVTGFGREREELYGICSWDG